MSTASKGLLGAPESMRAFLAQLDSKSLSWREVLLIFGIHVVIGLLIARSPMLATLHAAAVFGLGLWWGISQHWYRVAYAAAYLAGAEVLWRMTDARIPWEFGKYSILAVLLMALLWARRVRLPLLPILYFTLLVPAVWLTASELTLSEARSEISFNLSGPLALCICACFFSNVQLRAHHLYRLLVSMIAPVVSILAIAVFHLFSKLSENALMFAGDSNFDASGGFGPNQVSSALGIAAVASFFYIFIGRTDKKSKLLFGGATLLFLVQSALTFSRSGLAMGIGAVVVGSLFLLKRPQTRMAFVIVSAVIAFTATFALIPRLDSFTENAFSARFTDPTTTGRGELVAHEVMMFADHPLFGVGPGMAKVYRQDRGLKAQPAHTEYTRLIAEHGFLGLTALTLLFLICGRNVARARGPQARGLVMGVIVWSLLFMLVNAFRLAAPAFLIGLTFASLRLNETWNARIVRSIGA